MTTIKKFLLSFLVLTPSMLVHAKINLKPEQPDMVAFEMNDSDTTTDEDSDEDVLSPSEAFVLKKAAFVTALVEGASVAEIIDFIDETPELAHIVFFYGPEHYQVTPLLFALAEQRIDLVEALLAYGYVDQATNSWGTPLHYLAQLQSTSECDDEFIDAAMDMLLDANASVDILNNNDRTPLLEAVAANNIITIEKLARKKTSVIPALFLAIELENSAAIAALIQYSNVKGLLLKENRNGESAFYLITQKGLNTDVSEQLEMYKDN